jgi:hypothetical protein
MRRELISIFVKKSNMTFSQRFTRYLLGVGIGLIVVYFMFPKYDWLGWLPQKQVMQSIREAEFYLSGSAQCKMECLGIGNEQIQLARNEGRVEFSESDVKRTPKLYHLEYGNLDFKVELTDSTATLIDILSAEKTCSCP